MSGRLDLLLALELLSAILSVFGCFAVGIPKESAFVDPDLGAFDAFPFGLLSRPFVVRLGGFESGVQTESRDGRDEACAHDDQEHDHPPMIGVCDRLAENQEPDAREHASEEDELECGPCKDHLRNLLLESANQDSDTLVSNFMISFNLINFKFWVVTTVFTCLGI